MSRDSAPRKFRIHGLEASRPILRAVCVCVHTGVTVVDKSRMCEKIAVEGLLRDL